MFCFHNQDSIEIQMLEFVKTMFVLSPGCMMLTIRFFEFKIAFQNMSFP